MSKKVRPPPLAAIPGSMKTPGVIRPLFFPPPEFQLLHLDYQKTKQRTLHIQYDRYAKHYTATQVDTTRPRPTATRILKIRLHFRVLIILWRKHATTNFSIAAKTVPIFIRSLDGLLPAIY